MCFFATTFQVSPELPLLVLANRDEVRGRPWEPPEIRPCRHSSGSWLGGIDLRAGGTWLGVNARGLVAAVTNRPKSDMAAEPRSRGLLCRDMMECPTVEAALQEAERQMRHSAFAGFDLILLSRQQGAVIEAGERTVTKALEPGIHLITNGDLNDPQDGQIRRARGELERLLDAERSLEDWIAEAQRICSLRADGDLPALCQTGPDWGTVSSTVIALPQNPAEARYHFAPGPPAEVAYQDHSPSLQELLMTG